MGLRPLGAKWRRRIEHETGVPVGWANGGGGYVFGFTSPDPSHPDGHRHGWFNLHAYRAGAGEVWGWDDAPMFHWTSCSEVYGKSAQADEGDRTAP